MSWRNDRRLVFDNTCPVIDGAYEKLGASIDQAIFDVLEQENNALLEKIMLAIRPHIEEVRKTNINMRSAADSRIAELYDEAEELRETIDSKNQDISNLENEISDLK